MSTEPLSNVVQTAKALCSASGVRFTEKRQKVLEVLVDSPTPLSAYELVEQYQQKHGEEIQVMTVYRILEFLNEEHFVHRLNQNNKYVACTRVRCCQEHGISQFMICTLCDKVKEVSLPAGVLEALTKGVNETGFTLEAPHLEVACICDECKDKKEPN